MPGVRSTQDRLLLAGGILAIGSFFYFIGIVIYRLYFHPLAKFPGPVINRISDLPCIIWVLRGRLPMETKKIHDRYGPIVRISPRELSFNSVQAWTDIYGHRSGRKDLPKDPIHVGAVDPMPGVSTISMADHDTHARQRKALSYGFSKKALWEQEDIVQEFVTKLMNNFWRFAKSGETFDIVKWFNFITFDVIGDLSFGESFGCLDRGDFHFWITLIFEAVKAGAIEQATRRFATPGSSTQKFLMNCIPSDLRKRRADHLAYSRKKVMKRLQDSKSERRDFIYYILKQSEHYDLSQDEVIVNAALFIVAGSETTASSLSALMNNLLRYPRAFEKLKQEVRSKFKSENEIRLAAVADEMPYLNACLEEGLRIFPPAPIGFLRTIQKGGDTIDGTFIPGGTAVSVSSWCAHHSPTNFKNPDEFIPERWLDENGEFKNDNKLASRPFSLGPRGCIGKDLSWVEMRLVMARMIFNFDLFNADAASDWDPEDNMKYMRAYSTWEKPELNVKLVPRKSE
ncbi:cytochrome P450 [Rhizodiscina lignyota]|uniref:Cytochrome P450 n=1 Tax=Rhizodiscina lignyota TaxID=1504668 RepID=A0A9P4IP33_9PEZI|nr:cytochrome P450 [Rhizodiscina lignyota]